MSTTAQFRIVFLAGRDDAVTRDTIRHVCRETGLKPAAILLDVARPALKARLRNLRRNVRRAGAGYLWRRALGALRAATDGLVDRAAAPPGAVEDLLRRAFPERSFSLDELAGELGCPLLKVENLNRPAAVEALAGCRADLGIVLGTRVLKPAAFSVPRLGCLNLHKGRVPEYRGLPPGFWELYDGADSAGVTVHFVDSGLDTGDVVRTARVPLARGETPESLSAKLDQAGMRALAEAVRGVAEGTAQRRPQPPHAGTARTKPTPAQVAELAARLPYWPVPDDTRLLAKNLYLLLVYYSGLYAAVRFLHRLRPRAAVILYHRVNDLSRDSLTVDTETLAGHLAALARRRRPISTAGLVEAVRAGRPLPPDSTAIHFDDCYHDVLRYGAPLLRAAGWTAAAFVNSGYVDTDRVFPHDAASPWRHRNLSRGDLREWCEAGFEVGAHTVNHVDLGQCGQEQARREIAACRRDLEEITGRPATTFSYPFGLERHIGPKAVECVREAGCQALFSAHGGFVTQACDPYDIPPLAANYTVKPLYLLLELEGLAPHQILPALRRAPAGLEDRGEPLGEPTGLR